MSKLQEQVRVLEIRLYDVLVGFLAGYRDGRNIFTFAHEYINLEESSRPTLTLKHYHQTEFVFRKQLKSRQKLPPLFSNLLPEGELREYVLRNLKIHMDHEFEMFSELGRDLPGAITARELLSDEIPPYALEGRPEIKPGRLLRNEDDNDRFSLSGVLMKFSMFEKEGDFFISKSKKIGQWIIKVPSTRFLQVPLNEYSSMKLAQAAGIKIPDIRLVKLNNIKGFPDIKMPDEEFAYAVNRFDRKQSKRIHTEDFAQVFEFYPAEKYKRTNYDTVARTIYNVFPDAHINIQEFMARLIVNIMIGNGDAHLKNWSIVYPDRKNPSLSPAYDILFTQAYTESDDSIALNLGKEKKITSLSLDHFKTLASRSGVDWQVVKGRINETIEKARSNWPNLLRELPMADSHKEKLKQYWKTLTTDFKIDL